MDTPCWSCTYVTTIGGYSRLKINGKLESAHRVAYQLWVGKISKDLCICHRCDNPSCINPKHLFLGTHQDNTADKIKKGRQAKGDRHGSRTHPERLARGYKHGSKTHPERWARGEKNGKAKITIIQAKEIISYMLQGCKLKDISMFTKLPISTIHSVFYKRTWRHAWC
jgi:hypothetical protein